MKQVWAVAVAVALALTGLSGCKGSQSNEVFYYDIPGPVENLDPQFSTDSTARMILGNLFEGLVTLSPEGEILPGVAESHQISADGLTYTFTLREDAAWSNEDPVTSEDFLFAFRRIFLMDSPYAKRFGAIAGSDGVTMANLGVKAPDPHTLVIELSRPDPFFMEKLCDPSAAPCNESFFDETRGRYGLEEDLVCSNGPFRLSRWDNERMLQLWPHEGYRSEKPVLAGGVNLYIGRDGAKEFLEGNTDVALLDFSQQEHVRPNRATLLPVKKTVWCIVFNQDSGIWKNPLLRQGLSHTVDRTLLGDGLPAGFSTTSTLIPDSFRILDRPFREYASDTSPLAYDTTRGARLFDMGLTALDQEKLPTSASFVFPELAAGSLNMGELQQNWQRYLFAYLNFESDGIEQIESKFRTRDYQMLLMPFTSATSEIDLFLGAFASDSSQNYMGYRNPLYDDLLASAAVQPTAELAAQKYAQAETLLLSDAVVIPLFFETSYLAVSVKVEGLEVSPFADRISFKYAVKR